MIICLAITLAKQHVSLFFCILCITGICVGCMPASLLYADGSKSRQTHYWILGCVAAVGTARGGGQMKDDCTAAGIRCRKKCRESVFV